MHRHRTFYISNAGAGDVLAGDVLKVAVTGLNLNDIYVSVGSDNAVDQLDPATGKLTAFIVGLNSPHGMEFVPQDGSAAAADGAIGSGFAELVNSLLGDAGAGQPNQFASWASGLAQGGGRVTPPPGAADFAAPQLVDQLKALFPAHIA